MKKARTILFLFLALFFFSKSIASYAADSFKSVYYVVDLDEKEPVEKTEKNSLDGKEKSEDWMIDQSGAAVENRISQCVFRYYQESSFLTPYFEISPPPPERGILS